MLAAIRNLNAKVLEFEEKAGKSLEQQVWKFLASTMFANASAELRKHIVIEKAQGDIPKIEVAMEELRKIELKSKPKEGLRSFKEESQEDVQQRDESDEHTPE